MIPGSNKLGRITHTPAGNLQTGADPERLKEVMKVLPPINADLNPGKYIEAVYQNQIRKTEKINTCLNKYYGRASTIFE